MSFRDDIRKVFNKHKKQVPLMNDRQELMAAVCLKELGWDGEGFSLTEGRYGGIEKHMRWLDKREAR